MHFYVVVPHISFKVLRDGLFAQHKGRWRDNDSLTQLSQDRQETHSRPQRSKGKSPTKKKLTDTSSSQLQRGFKNELL